MRADPVLVRIVGLYGPIAATVALAYWRRPDHRAVAGALLATLWNLPALWAVHLLAVDQRWWTFQPVPGSVDGLPADLWIGWALLWGAVPVLGPGSKSLSRLRRVPDDALRRCRLARIQETYPDEPPPCRTPPGTRLARPWTSRQTLVPRLPVVALVAVAAWLDVMLMPLCAPLLQLGDGWWIGELVAIAVALVPAVLLGRWTADNRRLLARTTLQAVLFTALTFGLGTRLAVHVEEVDVPDLTVLQVLVLPGAVALAGVTEFATRGAGTPFPYDPPRRLVTTGPYAYVANPMQLGMVLTLLGWAVSLGSWATAAGAVLGGVFAAGFASWHEREQLAERYGEPWRAYRREVRNWVPRWRPHVTGEAVLYAGLACDVCSPVARWVDEHEPHGLRIVDAASWPGEPLRRMTYLGADGYRVDGVRALARALEHTTLIWAFAGWLLRLPLLVNIVQLLLDASGAGPRTVAAEDFHRPNATSRVTERL